MKAKLHKCEWVVEGMVAMISTDEIEIPKDNSLTFLQKLVGGLIDVYHDDETGNDLVLNDEGLLLKLPLNPVMERRGLMLVGNIIEVDGRLP